MNEDYQQAAGDYYTTLECYQKASTPTTDRNLFSIHYVLGILGEMMRAKGETSSHELAASPTKHFALAKQCCQDRIALLKERVGSNGKAALTAESGADAAEIEELEAIYTEVADRIEDLEGAVPLQPAAGAAGATSASTSNPAPAAAAGAVVSAPSADATSNAKAKPVEVVEESTWGFGNTDSAALAAAATAAPIKSLGVMGKGVKRSPTNVTDKTNVKGRRIEPAPTDAK